MSEYKIDFTKLAPDDLFLKTLVASVTPRYPKSVVDNLVEEARKAGREEAWDLAQRILLAGADKKDAYTVSEVFDAFGLHWHDVLAKIPVEEALEKDRAYQKKKEEANKLHIGDEVTYTCGGDTPGKGFVAHITDDGSEVRILMISSNSGMSIRFTSADRCKKTGKHSPDVVKVLEALKEESDAAKNS